MALIDMGRTSGHTSPFAGNVLRTFSRAASAVSDWNNRRQTRKILFGLTSHELDDIGLSRADIDRLL